jgi:hypothetical protein
MFIVPTALPARAFAMPAAVTTQKFVAPPLTPPLESLAWFTNPAPRPVVDPGASPFVLPGAGAFVPPQPVAAPPPPSWTIAGHPVTLPMVAVGAVAVSALLWLAFHHKRGAA